MPAGTRRRPRRELDGERLFRGRVFRGERAVGARPHINLFVDRPALDRWREQHPSVATLPLPLAEAIGLADRLAGDGPPITLA